MKVIAADERTWNHERIEALDFYWSGHKDSADIILALCAAGVDRASICKALRRVNQHFSVIIAGDFGVVAAVDKIRSRPLFYTPDSAISPNARRLSKPGAIKYDNTSLVEFVMTGYVTGSRTLCNDILQLQSGEVIFYDRSSQRSTIQSYYRYSPTYDSSVTEQTAVENYQEVVNSVFTDLIDRLAGRPAWIPLSGGYDSRIIVCKLHELGYKNIVCFSYGPKGNHDARVAKHVAQTLGLPWLSLPSNAKGSRTAFHDSRRREYWRFADGLSVIPSIREWQTLLNLVDNKTIPRDAVLINGQTGDYLSGGHIPAALLDGTRREMAIGKIIEKHWSLWNNWRDSAPRGIAETRIVEELGWSDKDQEARSNDLIAAYESWEYQERQSKFVVGGQRMYDFFGIDWELPHWDGRLVDFWERIPRDLKFRQRLFKEYLRCWNYKSLFLNYDPFVWRWPTHMMWVLPVAKAVQLTLGQSRKESFYRFLWYFSHYHNLYGIWGYPDFRKTLTNARSPISLQVRTWLLENGVPLDPNENASWKGLV